MSSEESNLVARLKKGDRAAYTEAVTYHHPLLLGVARAMLRDASEAEDACQDAWIAAMRGITAFEGRSSLRTWLTRIVINEVKMRLRRGGRELSLDAMGEPDQAFEDRFREDGHWSAPPFAWRFDGPEELLSEEQLRHCFEQTMATLPEGQRTVLEMRDMRGIAFEEICNTLELGASNVRVLLHRARTRLFQMVDHYTETGQC